MTTKGDAGIGLVSAELEASDITRLVGECNWEADVVTTDSRLKQLLQMAIPESNTVISEVLRSTM